MPYLLRGALIEYGTDLIGPIPNVVIFQFNPESLTRSLKVPERPTGATARERTQACTVGAIGALASIYYMVKILLALFVDLFRRDVSPLEDA